MCLSFHAMPYLHLTFDYCVCVCVCVCDRVLFLFLTILDYAMSEALASFPLEVIIINLVMPTIFNL